jgi:hypothetical protein
MKHNLIVGGDYMSIKCTVKYNLKLKQNEADSVDFITQAGKMVIPLEEIVYHKIFELQTNNNLSEGVPLRLEAEEIPRKDNSNIRNYRLKLLTEQRGVPLHQEIDIISLLSHSKFFYNKILADTPVNKSDLLIHDLQLLDLIVDSNQNIQKLGDRFFIEDQDQQTFSFISKKRPQIAGFICWGGGAIIQQNHPIYLSQNILETFASQCKIHHPKEIGAQLGGMLCKDKKSRFMLINKISFFSQLGNEISLNISAEDFIRTATDIEGSGRDIVVSGWVHSHGFGENALWLSSVDLHNHYNKYTIPWSVMLIGDGSQLSQKVKLNNCEQCRYNKQCHLPTKSKDQPLAGWSLYGWNKKGVIIPNMAYVYDE